jgi:hypothetical protein
MAQDKERRMEVERRSGIEEKEYRKQNSGVRSPPRASPSAKFEKFASTDVSRDNVMGLVNSVF